MWCTSRLIALSKPDGGIRPIAVGELIYRLCTKAILRHSLKPDFLLPYQFGVGTKGGVEPLIHAVGRALDHDTGKVYTHLTSLDFSNAFNTLERRDIASAARTHAPPLYRLAKWAYNNPSDLVMVGHDHSTATLSSSQGVRQGDPLGPFLFSLGIRPLLQDLATSLGPDCTVLAYLDDIYILSNSDDTLSDTHNFFSERDTTLQLNMAKSSITDLNTIRDHGLKVLGTTVGPHSARLAFLKSKIDHLRPKLNNLINLPHQHALLTLRLAVQQDLRHLQRTLKSDDLSDQWDELDNLLWDTVRQLRGSTGPLDQPTDNTLLALPIRLGGVGILSHKTCAPHAYAASLEQSNMLLDPLFGTDVRDHQPPKSQHDRCQEVFTTTLATLLPSLQSTQQQAVLEAGSILGRQWLSIIPYNAANRLTNFEVSAALHLRTLLTGNWVICRHCGQPNTFGHDEVCPHRAKWTVARHEQIKRTIANTLSTLPDTQVHLEPFIANTARRNDISITGSRQSGMASHEYDITVVSLATQQARGVGPPPGTTGTTAEVALATAQRFLATIAREKRLRMPEGSTVPFTPLVFTVGGLMEKTTADTTRTWKNLLPAGTFRLLLVRLSLILVRARTRNFDL
jgi:hypothetical protein